MNAGLRQLSATAKRFTKKFWRLRKDYIKEKGWIGRDGKRLRRREKEDAR